MADKKGRRPYVDNSTWVWMAGIGLLFIAFGLILGAFNAARLRELTNNVNTLESRRVALYSNQNIAEDEVSKNQHLYASHWSAGISSALAESRKTLEDGGSVYVLQQTAQAALEENDIEAAQRAWEQADAQLKASEQIIVQILGPPMYYEQLKQKSDAIDNGYLTQVQTMINTKRLYVENMPQKLLCGSSNTLSYASAVSLLDQAQYKLDSHAHQTLRTTLPEGIVDKPLAYDQAQEAENLAISAATTADNLSYQADAAVSEIASCDANIVTAGVSLVGAYDYASAQSNYDLAVVERTLAYASCSVQDFSAVSIHVSNCITYSVWSVDAAEPPPPTPVPQNDDDDDCCGSLDDWDSDDDWSSDDGWDDSSDDWSSDDWGSDDGWDSSDDWGSDDGWDSSDDWSSDDGW
jgi:hypothetical protein